MKKTLFAFLVVATMISLFALPALVSADPGDVLWGVTGVNWQYSEVFKVDVATGVVTIVRANAEDPLYSDIAVTPDGKVYTVGMPDYEAVPCRGGNTAANFNDLYRLDPDTGMVINTWENVFTDWGFCHVNALAAEDNSHLLAIEGGGVCPSWGCTDSPQLLRITLDGDGGFVSITSIGIISIPGAPPPESTCCDGDLDQDTSTGKWYAGFWETAGSGMVDVNLADPGNSNYVSQSNISYQGGFAFTLSGTAYAGSWADEKLYTVNLGGGSAVAHDLSGNLSGAIWGLSRDRAPIPTPTPTPTPTPAITPTPSAVGGTDLPTDKTGLLMPWIAAGALILIAAASLIIWNRKRVTESSSGY